MQKIRGFTIIELLVVVAIIAVLAAIVLVNVTSYINKGKDAAIRANSSSLLVTSVAYFDANGTYSANWCSTTVAPGLTYYVPIKTAIEAAGGTSVTCTVASSSGTLYDLWCVSSKLKTDTSKYFCADSTGKKSESTTAICAAGACPN